VAQGDMDQPMGPEVSTAEKSDNMEALVWFASV
jgi:hypothetical protein